MENMYSNHISWDKIKRRFMEGKKVVSRENEARAEKLIAEINNLKANEIHMPQKSRKIYVLLGEALSIGLVRERFVKKVVDFGFI